MKITITLNPIKNVTRVIEQQNVTYIDIKQTSFMEISMHSNFNEYESDSFDVYELDDFVSLTIEK